MLLRRGGLYKQSSENLMGFNRKTVESPHKPSKVDESTKGLLCVKLGLAFRASFKTTVHPQIFFWIITNTLFEMLI